PLDDDTFLGPMITEKDAARLEAWTREAVEAGAKVLCGGEKDGRFFQATLLEDVPRDCKASAEEAFGPLACLEPFDDFAAACAAVDDSAFGLQAGIFTNDLNRAFYAWDHLDVGGVVINDVPSVRVDSMPYGGVKDSGLGREGIRFAMEDMSEIRLMMLKDVGRL
ncbi:MAG: aldehyde dehydrogenase family protein, partial [Myxococcales bacterium]|nr:aldehyde dehydrogenase family protein [Myxococcales bacterium]